MSSGIAENTINVDESTSGGELPLASSAIDETPKGVADKRSKPRREIARKVHIGTGLGPSLECELKDISQTGARLRFIDPNCAPQEFLVRLNDGVLRWCKVMWRSKTEIGIRFIKIPESFAARPKTEGAADPEQKPQPDNNADGVTIKVPSAENAPGEVINGKGVAV